MRFFEIIRVVIFSMPLGIFITFGLFLAIAIQMKVRKLDVLLRRLMAFYCLSAAVASLLLLFYYYFPILFARFDILYCISVILSMVLFYHFLCFAIKSDEPFSFIHYTIPIILCAGIFICKLYFPLFWGQEGNNTIFVVALIFSIIYSLLPLYKMYNYHLKLTLVSHTANMINKSRIIPFIFEVILFPVTFIVVPLITKQNPGVLLSFLMMICILLALRMNIPLTYAMIRHYTSPLNDTPLFGPYISKLTSVKRTSDVQEAEPVQITDNVERTKRVYRKYTDKNRSGDHLIEIDKKEFENYFRKYKPYLNPDLRINDLTIPLQSNRTYISKFVNHTYKMNFSSYINYCRLREMERLLKLPGNERKSPGALIGQTGFGNYRNYLRIKKQFNFDDNRKM